MLKVDLVDQLEHMTRVRLEPALGEIAAPFIRKAIDGASAKAAWVVVGRSSLAGEALAK